MKRSEADNRRTRTIARTQTVTGHSSTDPDRELVSHCAQGDVDAFEELVARHQRAVYGIVSRMIYNRDDVDDLAQDIFVLAYRSIRSFRGDSNFATWLHRIAVNATLKYMRRGKNRQTVSLDDPETALGDILAAPNQASPAELAHTGERNEAVRQALELLPARQRMVVTLHYFEEYTCDEIADMLHCSVGTVWSRLHYACKKLRGQLDWLNSEG